MTYYFLSCNDKSRKYTPFRNYRFSIENYLNLTISFKNKNFEKNDILLCFTYDLKNNINLINNINCNLYIINTEHYLFPNIINIFKIINNNNNKNIKLIEYNVLNINHINSNFKSIDYYFIPQLYNPYLEKKFNKIKKISYDKKKYDILFYGTIGNIKRRIVLVDKLKKKYKIKTHHDTGNDSIIEIINESKIIINILSRDNNKIFDYFRNSFLLSNKILHINEDTININLSIEKNLIDYKDHLIFYNYNNPEETIDKYLKLTNNEYEELVNKQYEWFKKNSNMNDYLNQLFIPASI